jgi:hypothetical protein
VNVPVAGTYRITHPYGVRDYVVTTPGARAINQTQDQGLLIAQDFLASMLDAPPPPPFPAPTPPLLDAAIVNEDGATLGPFLLPTQNFDPITFAGGPVTFSGATYLGLPFAPNPANPLVPFDVFQPVTAALGGVDYFEIELRETLAPGFILDAAGVDGTIDNKVRFSNFQLIGKLFNDGPNVPPVAIPDAVGTSVNRPVHIDVLANDTDGPSLVNVHGINPQALALVHPDTGALVLTQATPTASGGSVQRAIATLTGKTTFHYTPASGFTGTDSFHYVVQDHGGLISPPAEVSITVENLQLNKAEYRPRLGKWQIEGHSTATTNNTVTLFAGPRAQLSGAAEVPAGTSQAAGTASLRLTESAIEFKLTIDPLPGSAVTQAHIHVGPPGVNGPIIFFLHDGVVEGAFPGSKSGTLTAAQFLPRPAQGVVSFADAVEAILSGNAYVNVHTSARPAGEIRGQFVQPLIGVATVDNATGYWALNGKSSASPGGDLTNVSALSTHGVRILSVPLRLR